MSVSELILSTATKALISSAVSALTKSFFLGDSNIFPYSRILNSHQNMLEDIEVSALKTYRDYYKMNDISKAADALMSASNRDANPTINLLLGATLYKLRKYDIAFQKISTALNMNPLLANVLNIPIRNIYDCSVKRITSSIKTPYVPEDTFSNKIKRRLGSEINEGIWKCEFCTFGLNISFNLLSQENVFGALNIENGEILWISTEESSYSQLIINTPFYTVLKNGSLYYIYDNSGICVKTLSENSFNLLFGTISDIELLHNSGQFYMSSSVRRDMNYKLRFPFNSTKNLAIRSELLATHNVARARNRYDAHPEYYYAYKILLSIE